QTLMRVEVREMTQQVYVLDAGVQDADSLLAGIPPDALVIRLDAATDGVLQLAAALSGLDGIDALHILSHGNSGVLALGSVQLDSNNLAAHASALATIGAALSADADVLLYGCNVAEGEVGASFMEQLAAYTGADVAASTDITGAGGNWILESRTGRIEATA